MARIDTKAEKFARVEEVVLRIIAARGERGLSISQVSRDANVSRAWIYKNFGSCTQELLQHCGLAIGRRFSEVDQPWLAKTPKEGLAAFRRGAHQTLRDVERMPWITRIYFQYFGTKGPLGHAIADIEATLVRKAESALCETFKLDRTSARQVSIQMIKTRMVLAHAWIHDPKTKTLGEELLVEWMMPQM